MVVILAEWAEGGGSQELSPEPAYAKQVLEHCVTSLISLIVL